MPLWLLVLVSESSVGFCVMLLDPCILCRLLYIFIYSNGNQKVCVVGMVGKCHLQEKNSALNELVDHNVFQVSQ